MSKELLNALIDSGNMTVTKNGGSAYSTTKSYVLDFFSKISALRNESDENIIIKLFTDAYQEDKLLTLKALFYNRDIRGGQGERKSTRIVLKYLAKYHTSDIIKNIPLIPEYGRYDDLYALFDTKAEPYVISYIKDILKNDMESQHPSILAKWLKSENASSSETKKLAYKTRMGLGLDSKTYRKILSKLRDKIKLVENLMSQQKWGDIQYDKIPSKAGMKYRKSFFKNDEIRYKEFIASLNEKNSKKTINVKDLYPYEIIYQLRTLQINEDVEYEVGLLNSMWDNLPNYYPLDGESNMLTIIDTSGSMSDWGYYNKKQISSLKCAPIDIAISLGLYIAERNDGPFKNYYINFNNDSKLYKFNGINLYEKIKSAYSNGDWGGTTNLHSALDLILNTAISSKLPQEKMIKKLIVISDMQINPTTRFVFSDESNSKNCNTNNIIQEYKDKYINNGYNLPEIIFWNVNAQNQDFSLATKDENGVKLISGFSPSILKHILSGTSVTPYDQMIEILNSERYNKIIL